MTLLTFARLLLGRVRLRLGEPGAHRQAGT